MSAKARLVFRGGLVIMVIFILTNFSLEHGFTRLLSFGDKQSAQHPRHPLATGVYLMPNTGYDGQFYAQLAFDPSLRDPTFRTCIDHLPYRARRIGLPLVAWSLGWGNPAWVLQVFALLNVAIWLILAVQLRRWLSGLPEGEACLRWAACLFAVGTLDSVRQSLTDLPATWLCVWSLVVWERGPAAGSKLLAALAVLTKETSLLLCAGWWPVHFRRSAWTHWIPTCVLISTPWLLWMCYLSWTVGFASGIGGNLDWPGAAMIRYLPATGEKILSGQSPLHAWFGILAALSGLTQVAVYAAWRDWHNSWWRVGAANAVLFLCLGDSVWASTMAPLRVTLPMTWILLMKFPTHRWFPLLAAWISLPTIHGFLRWMFQL